MEKKMIGNGMEISDIEVLAKILKDNDLGKIMIKNGEFELCVEGKKCPPPMGGMPVMAAPAAQAADGEEKAAPAVLGKEVKAPIVGTFYAAPSPTEKPFVTVGDTVKKGDTIYIIESMKVMNEVQSEFDGVVKEICVSSGDSVEFEQTVMIIG